MLLGRAQTVFDSATDGDGWVQAATAPVLNGDGRAQTVMDLAPNGDGWGTEVLKSLLLG